MNRWQWQFQIASDIIRDGLGLELLDKNESVVAEVFRCDKDRSITMRIYQSSIPEDVINKLVEKAKVSDTIASEAKRQVYS